MLQRFDAGFRPSNVKAVFYQRTARSSKRITMCSANVSQIYDLQRVLEPPVAYRYFDREKKLRETPLMQTSAERFNTISENFTKSEVHRLSPSMIRFSELIGGARDLTIGDIACGPGHFGFSLAGHAARIVGIDPSHNMLKQFRDLGMNLLRFGGHGSSK